MAGLSNACYRVSSPGVQVILYRKFECKVIDKNVEALIFRIASEQELGPKLLFQCPDFRLEAFLEGRPLSIWEMRNPVFMDAFVDKIFNFNFNETLQTELAKILPLDRENLFADVAANKWGPEVKERFPSMRGKLLQDNGIPHPDQLRAIDAIDRNFLF